MYGKWAEFLHFLVIAGNKNFSLVKVEKLKIYVIQCCIKILVVGSENIFTVDDTLTHKEPSVGSVVTYILLVMIRVQ